MPSIFLSAETQLLEITSSAITTSRCPCRAATRTAKNGDSSPGDSSPEIATSIPRCQHWPRMHCSQLHRDRFEGGWVLVRGNSQEQHPVVTRSQLEQSRCRWCWCRGGRRAGGDLRAAATALRGEHNRARVRGRSRSPTPCPPTPACRSLSFTDGGDWHHI